MKINSKVLALIVLQVGTWETVAFFVGPSRASPNTALKADTVSAPPGDAFAPPSEDENSKMASVAKGLEVTRASQEASTFHSNALENFDSLSPTIVQGSSLRTFTLHPQAGRAQLVLNTIGRPLNSKIELWNGPDYTPTILKVYLEDGLIYPLNVIFETPYSNTVAVYNTAGLEFPLSVGIQPETEDRALESIKDRLYEQSEPLTIQGGALRTFRFEPMVQSVQIYLRTDGRHLKAKVELLQGPNNIKQLVDVYSSDGKKRSFFAVFETPGTGNVIRIINTGPLEYPIVASVEPFVMDEVDMSATTLPIIT